MQRLFLRGRRTRGPRGASALAEIAETEAGSLEPCLHGLPRDSDHQEVIYRGQRRPMSVADWQAAGYPLKEARHLFDEIAPAMTHAEVLVISSDGVGRLRHYRFHAECFKWGYRGSGPAELSRCILLHHYGVTPVLRGRRYPPKRGELPVSYQAFKCEVIAALAQAQPWELTAARIREWARGQR
jgi:hypothetical protein